MGTWTTDIGVNITRLINSIKDSLSLNKMAASGGTKLYNDTTTYSALSVKSIVVREDTVFDTLTGFDNYGNAVDFETEFNISGKTLSSNDLLIAPNGWRITVIKLTSGSILAYS